MTGLELKEKKKFVAATYNVHGWRGLDKRLDSNRILDVIKEIGPDVIALQEATFELGSSSSGIRKKIKEHTGMNTVAGRTRNQQGRAFGHLLLTRHPIEMVRHVDLSFRNREPRKLLDATLQVGETPARVLATHLGLSLAERRYQVLNLLNHINDTCRGPLILMGDFNAWLPATPWLRLLDKTLGLTPRPATYPAPAPILPLDRIWVRPGNIQTEYKVHKTDASRKASDHLPLVATLNLSDIKKTALIEGDIGDVPLLAGNTMFRTTENQAKLIY